MISKLIGNNLPIPKIHINIDMINSMRRELTQCAYIYKSYILSDGRILTVNDNRMIIIKDSNGDVILEFFSHHTHSINRIIAWEGKISKNNKYGTYIITVGNDGHINLFDLNGELIKTLIHEPMIPITCVITSNHDVDFVDALIYTGAKDGSIKIFSIKSNKTRHILIGHSRAISSMCFVKDRINDDIYLVSIDRRDEIKIWDQITGNCIRSLGYYEENELEQLKFNELEIERKLHEEHTRLNMKKRHTEATNIF